MDKLASSIITVVVVIAFIAIWVGVIPWMYNDNVEHHATHDDYCKSLAAQIASDKANHLAPSIIITDIQTYNKACSG